MILGAKTRDHAVPASCSFYSCPPDPCLSFLSNQIEVFRMELSISTLCSEMEGFRWPPSPRSITVELLNLLNFLSLGAVPASWLVDCMITPFLTCLQAHPSSYHSCFLPSKHFLLPAVPHGPSVWSLSHLHIGPHTQLLYMFLPLPRCDGSEQQSPIYLTSGTSLVEDDFSTDGHGGRFRDDSSILHLLCNLSLLLVHQFQLRSSGFRSRKLGSPGLEESFPRLISLSCSLIFFCRRRFLAQNLPLLGSPAFNPWIFKAWPGPSCEH